MQRVWSQGDLVLLEEPLPADAIEVTDHDGVLAYGEATSHRHKIVKGEVRYFRSATGFYAYGLTDFETGHEDHPAIKIPRGVSVRYYQEREADWFGEETRNVSD